MDDYRTIRQNKAGHWFWNQQAANGEIVATSGEDFESHANAVRAALRNFPGIVKDETGQVVDQVLEDGT